MKAGQVLHSNTPGETRALEPGHFEAFHEILVRGISRLMACYEQAGLSWNVCGVNLRYAIERELYFKFVTRLEYFYSQYYSKKRESSALEYNNRFVAEAFKLMCDESFEPNTDFPEHKHSSINELLTGFTAQQGRILFNIVAPRFLLYLSALRKHFDCDIHLLCKDGNPELVQAVKATGLPYSLVNVELGEASIGGHVATTMSARCLSSMVGILHRVRPEKIVNIEGCHVEDQLLCELAKRLNISSICIQHGYAHFYPLTIRNMCYSKFLCWGEYFKEGLQAFNPATHFIPVGHFQLPESDSEAVASQVTSIGFLLQGVKYYITQEHFDAFIEVICWAAKSFPNIACYVREHPSNPISERDHQRIAEAGAIFLNNDGYSITEFLARCQVVSSISASSLVEALGAGVLPVYVNLPHIRAFDRLQKSNPAVCRVESVAEAHELLHKLVNDKAYYQQLCAKLAERYRYMYANTGEAALTAIAQEIAA